MYILCVIFEVALFLASCVNEFHQIMYSKLNYMVLSIPIQMHADHFFDVFTPSHDRVNHLCPEQQLQCVAFLFSFQADTGIMRLMKLSLILR